MADLFQGSALPSTVTTTQQQATAPEFYTNYLQDIANLGQNAVTQGGVAGLSPLQQQAFNMAPDVAFAGQGSMGAGSQLLGEAGSTTAPDVVANYMNPYTSNVVDELGRLTNRNVQENVLPALGAGAIGSGQYGSQRQMQATGNTLRDIQSDLAGKQGALLKSGYDTATTAAQADLSRALNAGQAFGNLGTQQNTLATSGLNELNTLGTAEQTQGQKLLDYPMAQTQNFAKLLQGYSMPTGQVSQVTAPGQQGNFTNSPLSQIAGLGTLLAAFNGSTLNSTTGKANGGLMSMAAGGEVGASADDGMNSGGVPDGAAYHDGRGNFYDQHGYLVG
jgi:hypothetical protein